MAKDYYKTLGIKKDATDNDIKKAFRRLAKTYHPDANPNPSAEAKFKEINEAYATLSDPEKRKLYDQFGSDYATMGNNMGGAGGGYGYRQNAQEVHFEDSQFNDIFESLFGGFGRGNRQNAGGGVQKMRGQDITEEVIITLREAYEGTMRYVESTTRKSKVAIPKGATDGTKVRVKGEGEQGRMGGEAGDLYLVVKVLPDAQFIRDGDNLLVDVPCDMFTALLGGEVEVPTMTRPVRIKVAAGTQSGQKLRVAGKGMPKMRTEGEFGDLFAKIQITVPKNLTDDQRHLAQQLKEAMG
jgi:curved DNA-binding protein